MQRKIKTRVGIAAFIYSMTNAVLFGVGLITVLTVPALSTDAAIWIPVVVAGSFILAVPIAWEVAPDFARATGDKGRRRRLPRHVASEKRSINFWRWKVHVPLCATLTKMKLARRSPETASERRDYSEFVGYFRSSPAML